MTETTTTTTKELILTEEQQTAIDNIINWFESNSSLEYKLGGYAGTGKTTIIKTILNRLKEKHTVIVCAFTGKAVNVLNKKGVPASTFHSVMYNVIPMPDGSVDFELRKSLDLNPDLIISDESSMISTGLYNDLKSFGIPCLFVGDPGQLEPVGDNPNLMREPDYILSKIHRQAETSPIIKLAYNVRHGGPIIMPDVPVENRVNLTIRKKNFTSVDVDAVDQVICARNKTRTIINDKYRSFKSYPLNNLIVGEKIIVLRNNRSYNVFNGVLLFVDEIIREEKEYWKIRCHDEVDKTYYLPIWKEPFTNSSFDILFGKYPKIPSLGYGRDKKPLVYATYGYCITCHKSQGSEWKHVFVVDEWMPPQVWDMKRWRYTAITRAADKLTYCL